jgi:hypothetical protein
MTTLETEPTKKVDSGHGDEEITRLRTEAFDAIAGPRVGDFVRLPKVHPKLGGWTRLTHDLGDRFQTGGLNGSYYLTSCGLSYSGSLDSGVSKDDLVETDESKPGSCWIFQDHIPRRGGRVDLEIACRIFELKEGADTSGINELQCPFSLSYVPKEQRRPWMEPYSFFVTYGGMSHTAFRTEEELNVWLKENGLMKKEESPPKEWQRLLYAPEPEG